MGVGAEIAHHAALLPLAAMLAGGARYRRELWVVAGALGLSWVADGITWTLMQWDLEPAIEVTRVVAPVQMGVMLTALVGDRSALTAYWLGLIALSGFSWVQGAVGYEVAAHGLGSLIVAWYATVLRPGLLRAGLLIYFGLGAGGWVAFSLAVADGSRQAVLAMWASYQVARVVGLAVIATALWQEREGFGFRVRIVGNGSVT